MVATTFGDTRLPARFWSKVDILSSGCWEWQGAKGRDEYGRFWWQGYTLLAHRVAYETLVGPIPIGLEADHLCQNRSYVYPAHLEPVTRQENTIRGKSDYCPQGHPYSEENTYWYTEANGSAWRSCRTCHRDKELIRYHRRRQAGDNSYAAHRRKE